ncbi:iron superoxide dismutase [Angomonas deanei]|nr:iron superoxide dismutase [Angomonas deanei]|eukprot:EPY39051.1 iron superoxide dismutase [Angomonas deanei]
MLCGVRLSFFSLKHLPFFPLFPPSPLVHLLIAVFKPLLFFTFHSQISIMSFKVDPLPYGYDALAAKGISKEQVTFHYDKHHKGYATKLNAAAETNPELAKKSVEELIKTEKGPVFNSAAQLFNHNFYWKSLCPNGGGAPTGKIADEINSSFGSFDKFKEEFTAAANGHFGSGWAWLVKAVRAAS